MSLKFVPAPDDEPRGGAESKSARPVYNRSRSWWLRALSGAVCLMLLAPAFPVLQSAFGDWLIVGAVAAGIVGLVIIAAWATRRWGPQRKVPEPICAICGQRLNDAPINTRGGKPCPECGSQMGSY